MLLRHRRPAVSQQNFGVPTAVALTFHNDAIELSTASTDPTNLTVVRYLFTVNVF